MASRTVLWTGPEDRKAALGSGPWNKQAFRHELATVNGASHGSHIPTVTLETVKLFHLSASCSQKPALPTQTSPSFTCAHRKFYFSTLIFNSLCHAHSEDLVLCAELPEAWLHVPLAASFSTPDWSHLQARCLTSRKDSLPSTCLLPMEAVNNTGPFLVSWRAGVSSHHLQVNYFYLVTDHLSQWRHTSHSLPCWQMPSCPWAASRLPHTWKSSCALEPDCTCTAGVLFAAQKSLFEV